MIEEDLEQEAIEKVRAILGENFNNFSFAVLSADGTLFYDYTNYHIGKMLFSHSLEEMRNVESGILEGVWYEDDEEGDYE